MSQQVTFPSCAFQTQADIKELCYVWDSGVVVQKITISRLCIFCTLKWEEIQDSTGILEPRLDLRSAILKSSYILKFCLILPISQVCMKLLLWPFVVFFAL